MYGIIFVEMKYYFDTRFGSDLWNRLLKDSELESKGYLPLQEYPDHEAISIISTASRISGKSFNEILEEFGEFLAPYLARMYRPLINPEWKTLDMIENVDKIIHRVVRIKNVGSHPPELNCSRLNSKEVLITYNSPRKMCGMAKGIARGIARIYNEKIIITETNCIMKGDSACKIFIKSSREF